VTLRDFSFRVAGIEGFEGHAERLTVGVDGFEPQSLVAQGVELELQGSATDLGIALAAYAKDHPELFALPAKAEKVELTWRPHAGAEPWVTLRDGTVEPELHGGSLVVEEVEVVGFSVGKVGATWEGDDAEVVVGLGVDDLEDAPVTVEVEHALQEPRATFTLRPTPLDRLAGPLGVALPIAGVTASAQSELRFEGEGPAAPVRGSLEARLEGYRPPVPPEVKGIVFGDDTELSADVAIPSGRKKIALTNLQVKHGAFELKGEGSMVREPSYSVIAMTLKGELACNQLAAAAANIRVGGQVGSWLGKLAGKSVTGSVGVTVSLRADTRKLSEAALQQQIGIGCGLRPDRLIPTMPRLPKGLPKVPKIEVKLPKLPGGKE
jgi:hypothetical protein